MPTVDVRQVVYLNLRDLGPFPARPSRRTLALMRTNPPAVVDLPAVIDRWAASGIVTAEQADLMRADATTLVREQGEVRGGPPLAGLATEALGYLGGVIIVVAAGLVTGTLWNGLSTGARLALAGGAALLLLVAGMVVPDRRGAPGGRLRSVLWLGASAGVAAFLGLLGTETLQWSGEAVGTLCALGTTLFSAALWRVHRRYPLQQAAVVVPLLVGVGTATALLPDPGALPGLASWAVAVAWLALSWGGLVPGRRVGMALGSVGAIGASIAVLDEGWGVALALATLAALVLLAVRSRDLPLLGIASLGTLLVLPQTMARYFPGALGPALALLGVGVVLVVTAVLTTRRRTVHARERLSVWSTGDDRVARWVAGTTLALTAAVVLGAGLA